VERRGGVMWRRGRHRVAHQWFNADSGSGAPMIELGFGGERISAAGRRGGRVGGGGAGTVGR
jgi:hypothetical protein